MIDFTTCFTDSIGNGISRIVNDVSTPSFVYEENAIIRNCGMFSRLATEAEITPLYSLKPFLYSDALEVIAHNISGFSVSSLFEARLARSVLNDSGTVHISSVAYKSTEIKEVAHLCDYVTLNSLSQLYLMRGKGAGTAKWGLRVNPRLSFIDDKRYDPCRKHSKLGVPLDDLIEIYKNVPNRLDGLTGLHFHNNCDSTNAMDLASTIGHIERCLGPMLNQLGWINIGGGYIFHKVENLTSFFEAIELLRKNHELEVFIEPGASIVRDAGYIVSTVLDLFSSDDKIIAILDTAVNHMPEVFEYQYEPDVLDHVDDGKYTYILAGCTCLAGDIFGEYSFDEPLEVGSKVVFNNAGAYTLVKAHMFNGVNLPSIYAITETGRLELKKQFTYEEFASRCGVEMYENV